VGLLIRHWGGERDVWSVVHVPSVEAEDRRQRSCCTEEGSHGLT
jgi:hypothetical protein